MLVPASALLLAATLAAPADLDPARQAFGRGDYAAAASLALAVAQPPIEGAALYLAGLARFRAGRPAEALELIDRAATASDPPPAAELRYNRAACLYELGRFADAEAAFVAAADTDAALMAVALINAGFAALDAGAPERARALAERARALGGGPARQLLGDLDAQLAAAAGDKAIAEYREGLAAFDAGRHAEAWQRFHAAATLDPLDGRSRIMAGAASIRSGERARARAELEEALALTLDAADREAALGHLDSLSHGLGSRRPGLQLNLVLGGGFDSDALQAGVTQLEERSGTVSTATPSAFLTAGLLAGWHFRPRAGLHAEVGYSFGELAYLASSSSDRSLQTHALSASLELELAGGWRLGGTLDGSFQLTGASNFRPLQLAAGPALWTALDESERSSTRLDLGWQHKGGFGEFGYLAGDQLDAGLTQELRLDALTLAAGYRFRADRIGALLTTLADTPPTVPPRPLCPDESSCAQQASEPFGYTGHALWVAAWTATLTERLRFSLGGGLELRGYLDDAYVTIQPGSGAAVVLDRRRRSDVRWTGSSSASVLLPGSLWLSLRYDLVINRATLASSAADDPNLCGLNDPVCHRYDPTNRSYDKHVVTLSTSLAW